MRKEERIKFLNELLEVMVREGASDIYLKADAAPTLRIEGQLAPIETEHLSEEFTRELAFDIMPEDQRDNFKNRPEANFVYRGTKLGRFRVNAYLQRESVAMVMRKIRDDILDFETLGLPPVTRDLAMIKRGLVLVTGPTGSGKSTTLAAMIRYRNENSTGHILTIEDPIEFIHDDINCIVSQREVGSDTMSFRDALESAVRQAPDVLLVGEMRDVESVKAGIYFAETGHLVLSTLHSNNSIQTIERILQFFPTDQHESMLQQLAFNLKAVVCQRLLPARDGTGRVLALEIMIVNARMHEHIYKGNLGNISRELDQFHPDGMMSFDYSFIKLFREGKISLDECIRSSDNPRDMKLKLKKIGVYGRSSEGGYNDYE
ncbi:MAG: PilT/PilU family type 4a pilus ATPase [Candidatus Eremiobacteraeota bacterium]|nr:PilT/PilU family type 4a pilus ATPase [Candidatus Eremiobacteraeota bacterium]